MGGWAREDLKGEWGREKGRDGIGLYPIKVNTQFVLRLPHISINIRVYFFPFRTFYGNRQNTVPGSNRRIPLCCF